MKKFTMVLLLCLACTCGAAAFSACGGTVSVEGITLGESSVTLEVGDEYLIQCDIYPAESSDKGVVFTSSDQNIITVDSVGKVYAAAIGEAQITAVTNDGGFSVICTFIVTEKSYTVTFYADGEVVSAQDYTLSSPRVDEPSPPLKDGYTVSWEDYSLGAEDITVNAVYVAIEYEAVFRDDGGAVLSTEVYTVESESVTEPSVPPREHYTGGWGDYSLAVGGVDIYPVYTPEEYIAEFLVGGDVVSSVVYTVENWSVQVPEVPEKSGYTGAWEDFTLEYGGITVNAVYTAIKYRAAFTANGAAAGEVCFTVEDEAIAAPEVPSREGYTGEWEDFEIVCGDIEVQAVYTPVVYNITYENCKGAENANSVTYTVESNFAFSDITAEHYNFLGWYSDGAKITSTSGRYCDLVLTAAWEAVQYTVVFCYENRVTYREVCYTADDPSVEEPPVPAKEGYTGVWGEYFLNYETEYVVPVYTIVYYSAVFVADETIVGTVSFTVNDKAISAPELLEKDGYTGEWESYTLGCADITVRAVYTPVTYNITYTDAKGAENNNPSTYTVENPVTFEDLSVEHYDFLGWYSGSEKISSTSGLYCDLDLTAQWEAARYSVTFCHEDGEVLRTVSYTVENTDIEVPDVPEKDGYTGEWQSYTLSGGDITVYPVYTPEGSAAVKVTVTFIAGDETVAEVAYLNGAAQGELPSVPVKESYTGEWESFTVGEVDLTVYALYTSENASDGLIYEEVSEGALTVTGYTGDGGCVTVPEVYKNKTVTAVSASAFYGNTQITELVLPSTITSLDGGAFAGMSGLTAITLPYIGSSNSTASACLGYYFGTSSYSGGTAVKQYYSGSESETYYLPSGLTSVTVLGGEVYYGAFWGCSTLTEIIICGGVTGINDSALSGCSSLVSLTLPFTGTRKSTSKASYTTLFGYIFGTEAYSGGAAVEQYYSASAYRTYYIPKTLKSVTVTGGNIRYGTFWGCTYITSVTIGADVEMIGEYAFNGCSGLASVIMEADGSWTVNGQTVEFSGGDNAYEKIVEYGKYSWAKT